MVAGFEIHRWNGVRTAVLTLVSGAVRTRHHLSQELLEHHRCVLTPLSGVLTPLMGVLTPLPGVPTPLPGVWAPLPSAWQSKDLSPRS